MTTYVPAKKGVEYIFYMGLTSQSTGQFQSSATLAAGDFKVSIDGGALANLATLPAVTPAASKMVKVTLSTSEMNGDNITVIGSDAAGAEWDDVIINIQTAARQIDDLAYPTTSGRAIDVSAGGEVGLDWANIGSPTTTVNLSGTTVKTATDVETDTQDIQARLPAALTADGNIKADTLRVGGTLQTAGDIIGDTNDIQSRLPAALTADGNIKADTLRVGGTLQTAGDIIGDTNDIQSRLPAALSGDGFMKADLKSIDDELTNGNNATLNLKKLDIQNSAGDAIYAQATGGYGVIYFGDAGGMLISGGAIALDIDGLTGGGVGMKVQGGGGSPALQLAGGSGYGMDVSGISGVSVTGAEDAVFISSVGMDFDGIHVAGGGGTGVSIHVVDDIKFSDGTLNLTAIADTVWDAALADHQDAGSTGEALGDAGSAGDPWNTPLPGAYAAGTAGKIVGDNIKAKTDQLTFTNANQVDANVQAVNDTNLTGDGSAVPWGPA